MLLIHGNQLLVLYVHTVTQEPLLVKQVYACVEVRKRQRIMLLSFTAATEGFDPIRRKNVDRKVKNKYT